MRYRQSSAGKAVRAKYRQTRRVENAEKCRKYRHSLNGRLHDCFHDMIRRCGNPKHRNYKRYAGNGIQCLFKSADEFVDYVIEVLGIDSYEKIQGLEIHRIDNTKSYCPGNIEFLTKVEHTLKHVEMRRELAA